MTYFPDLTPYTYWTPAPSVIPLNIGWLSPDFPYSVGEAAWPDLVFLDHLAPFEEREARVNQTRGFHICELCDREAYLRYKESPDTYVACMDEIRVLGTDGIVYAAPTLLRHYITIHKYCPPEAFIQAVLFGPRPSSPLYQQAREQSSLP